jgi:protein-export membrane protein SecD
MIKTRAIAIFILFGALGLGFFNVYGDKAFKLGLDLAGGTHLVYQADISKVPAGDVGASMDALRNVIEKRINPYGVGEQLVQVESNSFFSSQDTNQKLIVDLPGVTDVNKAVETIGQTPVLEFRLLSEADQKAISASTTLDATGKNLALAEKFQDTGITGRMLQTAQLQFDQNSGAPTVSLVFTSEGSDLFASTTKANIGSILGIFLDGNPISLPVIRDQIKDGKAQITGTFDLASEKKLVANLKYGALPVPIKLLSTASIGASLGESALAGGVKAGLVAFLVIALFLIIWYRLPGVVAVVSLGVYTAIMLTLFKLIPVTLTAAGIAGFILSIGMAVDANILIFERMKEELRKGLSMWDAMHEGFARAWPSIRDSNLSSLITGAILYYFGSSAIVTGFALVFLIGVGVSMFTAITASRIFLYAISPSKGGAVAKFLFSNGFHFGKNKHANNLQK